MSWSVFEMNRAARLTSVAIAAMVMTGSRPPASRSMCRLRRLIRFPAS